MRKAENGWGGRDPPGILEDRGILPKNLAKLVPFFIQISHKWLEARELQKFRTIGQRVHCAQKRRKPGPGPANRRSAQGIGWSALGQILQDCRDYLLLVSNQEVPSDIRQKVAASDLVQQSLAEACRDFYQFTGHSDDDLRAWLRRILLNNLADATRGFRHTGKREVAREIPLGTEDSKNGIFSQLLADSPSPSRCAIVAEEQAKLFRVLERLPERYSQIIRLRNLEYRSLAEIGSCMGLSADAARKLWKRAVERLAAELRSCSGKD